MLDKSLIASVTVDLWLGILPLSFTWFVLYAISRLNNKPNYKRSERNVLGWIVKRYPIIMLIVSFGSLIAMMQKQDFDALCTSLLQDLNEVMGVIIWIIAIAFVVMFLIYRPPFRKKAAARDSTQTRAVEPTADVEKEDDDT